MLLDYNTLGLVERRGDSHLDLVSHVATNQRDKNILATAGNDGVVSTWDVRNMKEEAGCEWGLGPVNLILSFIIWTLF